MRGRRPPGTGRAGSSEGSCARRFARRLRAGSARRIFFFAAVGIGLSEASAAWTEGSAVHSERMPLLSGLTPGGLRAPMSPPMHPRARERERERETDRQTETDRGREKERARHLLLNWWPPRSPVGGPGAKMPGAAPAARILRKSVGWATWSPLARRGAVRERIGAARTGTRRALAPSALGAGAAIYSDETWNPKQ